MKKLLLVSLLTLTIFSTSQAQEYAVVTTVESVVPMGIGRPRMISNKEDVNVEHYTTERTRRTDTNQGQVKRKDIKINNLEEIQCYRY